MAGLRHRYEIPPGPELSLKGENIYTAVEAAEILGVVASTVIRWVEVGLLRGARMTEGAPWRIQVREEDRKRLMATEVEEGWLPLKGAALALGLSQQGVLHKLKSGELEGVRVPIGRRSAWRIRTPQKIYDDQPSLFQESSQ